MPGEDLIAETGSWSQPGANCFPMPQTRPAGRDPQTPQKDSQNSVGYNLPQGTCPGRWSSLVKNDWLSLAWPPGKQGSYCGHCPQRPARPAPGCPLAQ